MKMKTDQPALLIKCVLYQYHRQSSQIPSHCRNFLVPKENEKKAPEIKFRLAIQQEAKTQEEYIDKE